MPPGPPASMRLATTWTSRCMRRSVSWPLVCTQQLPYTSAPLACGLPRATSPGQPSRCVLAPRLLRLSAMPIRATLRPGSCALMFTFLLCWLQRYTLRPPLLRVPPPMDAPRVIRPALQHQCARTRAAQRTTGCSWWPGLSLFTSTRCAWSRLPRALRAMSESHSLGRRVAAARARTFPFRNRPHPRVIYLSCLLGADPPCSPHAPWSLAPVAIAPIIVCRLLACCALRPLLVVQLPAPALALYKEALRGESGPLPLNQQLNISPQP